MVLEERSLLEVAMFKFFQIGNASDVNGWLDANPAVFRLLQLLIWATNHPIWSLVIIVFALAIGWNLFKVFSRLLGIIGRELMQAPLKLLRFFFGVSAKSLTKVGSLAVKQFGGSKNPELPALPPASSQPVQIDKQQRLTEISTRLEALQKEQNELLQEVAAILATDKINVEI